MAITGKIISFSVDEKDLINQKGLDYEEIINLWNIEFEINVISPLRGQNPEKEMINITPKNEQLT